MSISSVLSKTNIDRHLFQRIQQCLHGLKSVSPSQQMIYKFIFRNRQKVFRPSFVVLFISLFTCVYYLFLRASPSSLHSIDSFQSSSLTDAEAEKYIDHVRDIALIDDDIQFNITIDMKISNIPQWISKSNLTRFFNFFWLQNGAYRWHLQQMSNFQHHLVNVTTMSVRLVRAATLRSSIDVFRSIDHHPESGILIDTSPDPIHPLFVRLPRTSSTLNEFCSETSRMKTYSPCSTRFEAISSTSPFDVLITYALYNVVFSSCDSCTIRSNVHYGELVYVPFENVDRTFSITPMTFIMEFLPRLIRLLALVPEKALILLPPSNDPSFIDQYLDVLHQRNLISGKNRFIPLNSSIAYHSDVLYSTSSPRFDLTLVQHVLLGDKAPIRRELILLLDKGLDQQSYNSILQTINQFELPDDYEYLHLHEYKETRSTVQQLSELFRQALIIISTPNDLLAHLVWCSPGTHLIEIAEEHLHVNTYRMSVQLKLNYWLARPSATNQIDTVDFRNLMLKVLTNIDN